MKPVVAVIGGGAAGFFGAISVAESCPSAKVIIFEKTVKVLSKVKVSGGGRCNVTHACYQPGKLAGFYPRGNKTLKKLFGRFAASDTVAWFEKRGVALKTEEDGRIFPVTNDSQTIIDCFLAETRRLGVEVRTRCGVEAVEPTENGFSLTTTDGKVRADKVFIATGGNAKASAYQWLADLGHEIVTPVPSLFTFNIPGSDFKDLAGISVPEARVKVAAAKLEYQGPLLITHWGLSGPAVLKTSAWGARDLFEKQYRFNVLVSWSADASEDKVRELISGYATSHPARKVVKYPLMELPQRLWQKLCERAGVTDTHTWAELPKKNRNKLLEELVRCSFEVSGKTTFKEEFVTAGGISLSSIHTKTLESKVIPGMYFSGEIIDIDGVTGGFNFQSAWTTAYLAGKAISEAIC